MELLGFSQIKTIVIVAEGVPERYAREILHKAKSLGVVIIGPATVGGIKAGCFKLGNTGGMMDNIVASKLYRPDGVYEGIAIGGDRYPGTTFIDHLLRYEADPNCKILLLLGEVGGIEEYAVIEAVKSGAIRKPLIAWCIGTCASLFNFEIQFGHAGSFANSARETASAKNAAMRDAGIYVPDTFEELPQVLREVYDDLLAKGVIVKREEPSVPRIPMDYSWAQELGLIRKPAAFISTISDDRGQELLYAGMPISDVFKEDIGIGGVMSLLWFRRRLPSYASKFFEMVLMLTADHGPAVSGAMNTIITTRAGKDLVSSLVSGLLTIGTRFGGALDSAAEEFTCAMDKGLSPRDFVDCMRKQNKLIPGIGHKVKSRNNPDLRVEIVKEYAKKNFQFRRWHIDLNGGMDMNHLVSLILERVGFNEETRLTYIYKTYMIHYIYVPMPPVVGLTYLCITSDQIERRIPFVLLHEIKREFSEKFCLSDICELPVSSFVSFNQEIAGKVDMMNREEGMMMTDITRVVRKEMDNVKAAMVENIEKVMQRGERIELLVDRTQNMNEMAFSFSKRSSHLRLNFCLYNWIVLMDVFLDGVYGGIDGCVAVCLVDLLRNCGAFTTEEVEDYLKMGVLNGLFVLGRSIGLIGHFLDQKRLRTGLYRHPWDDFLFLGLDKEIPGASKRTLV
ncbi:hypothetical protein PCK1_000951 [Pneumocystis canis]|nr:hypothetical protein PCK1_000951 [Pneumocystis canis]